MIAKNNYCVHCDSLLSVTGTRCPTCNLPLTSIKTEQHFLSGLQAKKAADIDLEKIGMINDRFEIKKKIGQGRYGSVYYAKDHGIGKEVALKAIRAGSKHTAPDRWQFKQEARIHTQIADKTHIIMLHDIIFTPVEDTVLLLLSMEYAEGGTFRKWLSEHCNKPEIRRSAGIEYFTQACKGVIACHNENIIHLDLKPENLLFCHEVLKVSDFGTAQYVQYMNEINNMPSKLSTFDSGTAMYMSPEHFTARAPDELDQTSDIYSLGIILYELLDEKCRPPFVGDYERLQQHHQHSSLRMLTGVDTNLSEIVARCLEKNPDKRYQNIIELLEDLSHPPLQVTASTETVKTSPDSTPDQSEGLLEEALTLFEENNLNEATKTLKALLSIDQNNPEALRLKSTIDARYAEAERFYTEISCNIETADLEELIEMLQEAIEIYPEHPSGAMPQKRLKHKTELYQRYMENGMDALLQENWDIAFSYFNQVQHINKGSTNLQPLIDDLSKINELLRQRQHLIYSDDRKKVTKLQYEIDGMVDEFKSRIPAFRKTL